MAQRPEHYRDQRWTHVVEPFAIPKHWRIWRGYDFGYSRPFSVGWYAVDEDGRIYRIKELYGCSGRPNEGLRWTRWSRPGASGRPSRTTRRCGDG